MTVKQPGGETADSDSADSDSADREAIVELAHRYCSVVDAGAFEGLRELFVADATAELGGSGQRGIDEIIERLEVALGRFERWEHSTGDHEVTVEGDRATARCALRAVHLLPPGGAVATDTVVGRYEDSLVRTAEGWRIAHRKLVITDRH
jgi:hypothetical protein